MLSVLEFMFIDGTKAIMNFIPVDQCTHLINYLFIRIYRRRDSVDKPCHKVGHQKVFIA